MLERLELDDAELAFHPQWLPAQRADAWLQRLDAETP